MRDLKAFLFDLDGTLVDTRESNFLAYREAFTAAGHILTREQFTRTWGMDSREFIPMLLPDVTDAQSARIRSVKAEVYGEHLAASAVNGPLVELARWAHRTAQVALVTTAKARNVEQTLAAHGIEDLFDLVVHGDCVVQPKPNPEAYLRALEILDVLPVEAMAFEDSDPGAAAADAAGLAVVRVTFSDPSRSASP